MAIITKLNQAKQYRGKTRSFRREPRWLKARAQRLYRRQAKRAVRAMRDVNETPRLTDRDIV